MTNSFKDAPAHSTRSHSRVLNSEGPQIYHSSITIAPTPSATARATAEKHLQDIHKQELKDCKQEYIYKAALNQATLKVLTVFTAQTKLVMEKIHQACLAAIKKNPTIINMVETDSNKSSLFFTAKSLDLLLSKIPISKIAVIQKGIFILKNLVKLYNNLFRINSNQIKLIADKRVITSSKSFKKDFFFIGIQLEGFINYNIII